MAPCRLIEYEIVSDEGTKHVIKEAFPELEIEHKMYSLVNYDGKKYQPKYPYETQIEYLLASSDIQRVSGKEEMIYSDHPFLIANVIL